MDVSRRFQSHAQAGEDQQDSPQIIHLHLTKRMHLRAHPPRSGSWWPPRAATAQRPSAPAGPPAAAAAACSPPWRRARAPAGPARCWRSSPGPRTAAAAVRGRSRPASVFAAARPSGWPGPFQSWSHPLAAAAAAAAAAAPAAAAGAALRRRPQLFRIPRAAPGCTFPGEPPKTCRGPPAPGRGASRIDCFRGVGKWLGLALDHKGKRSCVASGRQQLTCHFCRPHPHLGAVLGEVARHRHLQHAGRQLEVDQGVVERHKVQPAVELDLFVLELAGVGGWVGG